MLVSSERCCSPTTSLLVVFTTIIAGVCLGHCDQLNWDTSWSIEERDNNNNQRSERSLRSSRLPPQQFYANSLSSFNLVTEQRQDICTQHCTCQRGRNSFVTVTCDFQENPKVSVQLTESNDKSN